MFEVGFTEIVLILGIALLVLGPERLPKLAADLGRWAGKARAMARQLKNQLEQEAGSLNELRKPIDDIRNPLNDLRNLVILYLNLHSRSPEEQSLSQR